jgi:outer membrane protein assembly factor BamD
MREPRHAGAPAGSGAGLGGPGRRRAGARGDAPAGWRCGAIAAVALVSLAACASGPRRPPPGTIEPDRFLFERGTEELNDRDWFTAREYFRQLVDSYPQSLYRGDAKLGVGDTFLGEGTAEAFVLGINEFREFLSQFPTHTRADYAQYKLAMAHYYQMRGPMRDQTETLEAIKEFTVFVERYPRTCPPGSTLGALRQCSDLLPEVQQRLREARDRIGEHELGVGLQYFRQKWYAGAIQRLKPLLEGDPQFTRRDAALFYLAESYDRLGRAAEALPFYDRLLKEFEQSEFLQRAELRASEIKSQIEKKVGGL